MTSLDATVNDAAAAERATPTLRQRAVRSAWWVFFGFGFQNAFRLVSNIILSWMLLKELFGIMALVNVVMAWLQMFSDLGIGPNIIQSKRGESRAFLNTAWTVQAFRGFALWIIASLLAYPIALYYGEPQLAYVLPVVGLNALIAGFNSTHLFTLNRKLTIGRVTMLRSVSQIAGMTAMVGYAYFISPTIWALVVNGLVASLITLVASHTLIPGERNRFHVDRDALRELIRFGRWVFISTIITGLAGKIQVPMMGSLIGMAVLGLYQIAMNLADLGPLLVLRLGNVVGFPALAELHRRDEARFHYQLKRMRLMLIIPINLLLLVMIFIGPWFVKWFYHPSYGDAGWMLTFIAAGSLAGMVNSTYGHAFFALGSTWRITVSVAAQLVLTIAGCYVGWRYGGTFGFLFGITAAQWLLYPVYARLARTCGVWQPKIDLPVLLGFGVAPGAWIVIEKFMFPA